MDEDRVLKGHSVTHWKQLLQHKDPGARAEATEHLAELKAHRYLSDISVLLNDPVEFVRLAAVEAIGRFGRQGESSAIECLIRILESPQSTSVRDTATTELCKTELDVQQVLPRLLSMLGRNTEECQQIAMVIDCLDNLESEVLPLIDAALHSSVETMQKGAIRALPLIQHYSRWRLELLGECGKTVDGELQQEVSKAVMQIKAQPWDAF